MLQDLPTLNLVIFLSYLFISFGVGAFVSLKLLVPVFRWQRRDALLAEDDPATTEQARLRALRMPAYRFYISMTNWVLGAIVFIAASWPVASHAAPVLAVATLLGATATAIIGYLQSERVLRPVAVAALRSGVPEGFRGPGVVLRLVATWLLSTGVPLLAIVLSIVASKFSLLAASADRPVHADPADGRRCAGGRADRQCAGGHVDRRPAAPAALGARGGSARQLQRPHADLRRQRAGPAAGGIQRTWFGI